MFCGHEYSIQNLKFSSEIEPLNYFILARLDELKIKRKKKVPSVPSTIGKISLQRSIARLAHLSALY